MSPSRTTHDASTSSADIVNAHGQEHAHFRKDHAQSVSPSGSILSLVTPPPSPPPPLYSESSTENTLSHSGAYPQVVPETSMQDEKQKRKLDHVSIAPSPSYAGYVGSMNKCPFVEMTSLKNPEEAYAQEEDELRVIDLMRSKTCQSLSVSVNNFCLGEVQPWHVVVSVCQTKYPYLLPCLRITFACYMLAAFICMKFCEEQFELRKFFFYLTNVGGILLTLYFLLSGVHSFLYARSKGACVRNLSTSWRYYFRFIHSLYVVCWPAHLLISSVYWALIFKYHMELYPDASALAHWVNATVHGITCVCLLVEFCLNQMRVLVIHFVPYILFVLLYFGWMKLGGVLNAEDNSLWNPYPFLKWNDEKGVLYHAGLLGFIIVLFFFVYAMHRLKYTISRLPGAVHTYKLTIPNLYFRNVTAQEPVEAP